MSTVVPVIPAPAAISVDEPQHMRALRFANTVRCTRAALKQDIHAGKLDVIEAITSPWLVNMTASELLRSLPRVGRTRARKILAGLAISENRQLYRFTENQREILEKVLDEKQLRASDISRRHEHEQHEAIPLAA